MDIFELCIISIVLIIAVVVVFAIMAMRKIKGGEFEHGDMNVLFTNLAFHLQARGWNPKIDPQKGKITVEKDSMVATDIFFRTEPGGKIGIYHGANAAAVGWVVVIILILATSLVGLIAAVVLHVMSRNFAKNEVIPFVLNYGMAPPSFQLPQFPGYFPPPQ